MSEKENAPPSVKLVKKIRTRGRVNTYMENIVEFRNGLRMYLTNKELEGLNVVKSWG